mmetsp:Transcript_69254/g.103010  ORF Transcript_69254/g.103010 Transcript_69254/m.103010 type:complete len:341 (-) Transcript_69254:156-1178(-)
MRHSRRLQIISRSKRSRNLVSHYDPAAGWAGPKLTSPRRRVKARKATSPSTRVIPTPANTSNGFATPNLTNQVNNTIVSPVFACFPKASADVLKKRRIVKARYPPTATAGKLKETPTAKYLCGETTVDQAMFKEDASLASRAKVHENLHARLALVDQSKHKDGFYILQVLAVDVLFGGSDYYLFSRWGHTGTKGQWKLEGPYEGGEIEAETVFARTFESKTGVAWNKAVRGAPPEAERYEFLQSVPRSRETGSWFYYLKNDLDGKPDGWYEYDEENAAEVEELFGQYQASNCAARLSTRFVQSSSSGFTYKVVLGTMTQQNTRTGKTRPIQRTVTGLPPK